MRNSLLAALVGLTTLTPAVALCQPAGPELRLRLVDDTGGLHGPGDVSQLTDFQMRISGEASTWVQAVLAVHLVPPTPNDPQIAHDLYDTLTSRYDWLNPWTSFDASLIYGNVDPNEAEIEHPSQDYVAALLTLALDGNDPDKVRDTFQPIHTGEGTSFPGTYDRTWVADPPGWNGGTPEQRWMNLRADDTDNTEFSKFKLVHHALESMAPNFAQVSDYVSGDSGIPNPLRPSQNLTWQTAARTYLGERLSIQFVALRGDSTTSGNDDASTPGLVGWGGNPPVAPTLHVSELVVVVLNDGTTGGGQDYRFTKNGPHAWTRGQYNTVPVTGVVTYTTLRFYDSQGFLHSTPLQLAEPGVWHILVPAYAAMGSGHIAISQTPYMNVFESGQPWSPIIIYGSL